MTLERIPGDKARRYIDTSTGQVISRRQAIKILEGVTPEQKRAAREASGIPSHMGRYKSIVRDYKSKNPGKKVRGKGSDEFKKIMKALKSKDNRPKGRKAKALQKLGRRRPEWTEVWVGDSPI